MKTAHGLVIGKFYPPHAGHHLLVEVAADQCERVTVIVMAASCESIPLATRVAWLREVHAAHSHVVVTGVMDEVRIDYGDAAIWVQHVALMKQALSIIGAPRVTAVFTSEPYGAELARRFDAAAVTLDIARKLAPVSGTAVRANVSKYWDFLAPAVRAGLALRVVVAGAESSGTTTLSRDLAQALRGRGGSLGLARLVGEYGREYSAVKFAQAIASAQLQGAAPPAFAQLEWRSEEFMHIARVQLANQEAQARIGGPVLICDTDPFATAIWHERYLGHALAELDAFAETCRGDLYLLTHDERVPFVQDGLRDGETVRGWMTQRFAERLRGSGRRHVVLRGDSQARLAGAIAAVDELLAHAWRFAPPLGA